MIITLKNNFHGTEVRLLPRNGRLSPAQMRKAHRVLCGLSECKCGGIRGPQEYDVEGDGEGGAIVEWNLRLVCDRIRYAVDGDPIREGNWEDAIRQLKVVWRAGLSWSNIAKKLRVAPSTLYGWLDGRHEPSPLARNAIASLQAKL